MRLFLSVLTLVVVVNITAYAQWHKLPGPYGGSVNSILVTDHGIYLGVGGQSDGSLYRSDDRGLTWKYLSERLPEHSAVQSLAHIGSVLVIGTHQGVYSTSDDGQHWTTSTGTLSGADFLYTHGLILFNASYNTPYRSVDSGASWQKLSIPTNGVDRINVFSSIGTTVFAGSNGSGLFRSTDEGNNWTPVSTGIDSLDRYVFSLDASGQTLMLGGLRGCIQSTNGGQTWSVRDSGFPPQSGPEYLAHAGGDFFATVNGYGLYELVQGSSAWQKISNDPAVNSPGAIGVLDNVLLLSNGFDGIVRSEDRGASWKISSMGLASHSVDALVVHKGALYAGASEGDFGLVYRSTDQGATWQDAYKNISTIGVTSFHSDGDTLYAGLSGSGIYRTTNGGELWSSANTSDEASTYVSCITSAAGYLLFGTTGFNQGIYRSSDHGGSWAQANTGLMPQQIDALLRVGDKLFTSVSSEGIYVSTDAGANWLPSFVSSSPSSTFITGLASANGVIVATSLRGIYRSLDTGHTWVPSGSSDTTDYAHVAAQGSYVAVAGPNAVKLSLDAGLTWKDITNGLISPNTVLSLVFKENILFAGLSGESVWSYELPAGRGVIRPPVNSLQATAQPNPFHNVATLRYTISAASNTRIELFSMEGQRVATLFDGHEGAGEHSITIDSRVLHLSHGSYIVRITSTDDVQDLKVSFE